MATEQRLIDAMIEEDIRICPFDLLPVVCDGDCENCDYAKDDEEWN